MIEVRELVKSHGKLRVLDGISLSVERGEVAVVIGPSGGGKSTLLRCINGLETFQEGEVSVEKCTLRGTSPAATRPREKVKPSEQLRALRRRVGMVFQQFHLFPHMNVLENVMAGPRFALKWPREQAEVEARKLLHRVGLADKLTATPDQ